MMKQLVLGMALIFLISVPGCTAQETEFTEVIKKEIQMGNQNGNTLVVKNVFGSVSVEGYNGNTIQLDAEKTITADTKEELELGKKELKLNIIEESNRVVLHPDAPYIDFDGKNLKYNWCNNHDEPSYEHVLNIKIKVPNKLKLNISTVNNGEVVIKETRGTDIKAENINGGIALTNVTGKTKVHCINGAVDISYADNPNSASEYYSLNGDINISYQKSLSANISFKSMNGEMFTDFEVNKQFMRTKKKTGKGNKPKYKYEARPVVQIGSGVVDFDFETLNGNVFIKKI
ncbi:DUF4097 family beta strand repeat-containing protein [Flagellimonas flava]|uniref:DUF4097 and DUF4098 domain-containing protein YvlB n=1 Tax=Flagellimonas flava TaxID=570519 RepID=A0A1M5LSB6_9FLAO|nr:DUF4097 family beta strand repeat-containing protein [Allomuricauda flava]SHG67243.1 DUF4097 and DUF4098 domain-containing protein YvlB [Allomuricauda flava]